MRETERVRTSLAQRRGKELDCWIQIEVGFLLTRKQLDYE